MNAHNQPWNRLIAEAHRVSGGAVSTVAPVGFVTRVVARWLAERREGRTFLVWTAFAVPAFAVAAAVAIIAVVSWGPASRDVGHASELVALADPLGYDSLP